MDPTAQQVTIFSNAENAQSSGKDDAAVETVSFRDSGFDVVDVQFTSGASVFATLKRTHDVNDSNMDASVMVLQFASLQTFIESLRSGSHLFDRPTTISPSDPSRPPCILTSSSPLQLCTNATTLTALPSDQGQLHTLAPDPRFPKCLGRHPSSTAVAESIPYFSETSIGKIASGGYYTCAVSTASSSDPDDEEAAGELFIWGQAPPGTNRELSALQALTSSAPEDDDRDDFVCCVELQIDRSVASVMDVAVGWGHVLVSCCGTQKETSRAVFAAGCNGKQQLGLKGFAQKRDFVEDFTEIEGLREKRVVQMVCAGWSSYIVVEDDD